MAVQHGIEEDYRDPLTTAGVAENFNTVETHGPMLHDLNQQDFSCKKPTTWIQRQPRGSMPSSLLSRHGIRM